MVKLENLASFALRSRMLPDYLTIPNRNVHILLTVTVLQPTSSIIHSQDFTSTRVDLQSSYLGHVPMVISCLLIVSRASLSIGTRHHAAHTCSPLFWPLVYVPLSLGITFTIHLHLFWLPCRDLTLDDMNKEFQCLSSRQSVHSLKQI